MMEPYRKRYIITGLLTWLMLTNLVYGQNYVRQIHISAGGGINLSFFDIGGGSPGLSFTGSGLFMWDEHWKAGIHFGYHQVEGSDEGTAEFARGLAYKSEMYEISARGEYLMFFGYRGGAKWKLS